jgi:hypothetical protein
MVADGGGGWDSVFKAIGTINARSKRDACYHAPVKGVPGPIVVMRGYQFGEVYVREAMIHAILVRGEWQHLPTPRLYYTGAPGPLVSELPAWLAPAQYQSHVPPAFAPIVPAKQCGPGLENFRGSCLPDCRVGLCLRKRVA